MKYGLWTLSGETERRKGKPYYFCTCDCGTQQWVRFDNLKKAIGCRKCGSRQRSKHYQKDRESSIKQILSRFKRGAKTRNIEFSVTDQYLINLLREQNYTCALSGLPIQGSRREQGLQSASLDRIDSSKGYIEGNVQWVDKRVNMMKQSFSQAEFIELCYAISQHKGV